MSTFGILGKACCLATGGGGELVLSCRVGLGDKEGELSRPLFRTIVGFNFSFGSSLTGTSFGEEVRDRSFFLSLDLELDLLLLLDFLSEEDLWESEEDLWESEEDLCEEEEECLSFLEESDFDDDFLEGLLSFLLFASASSLMTGGGGVVLLEEDLGLDDFLTGGGTEEGFSSGLALCATRSLARRRGSRLTRFSSSFFTEDFVST